MTAIRSFLTRRFSRRLNRPCRIIDGDGEKISHLEIGNLGEGIADHYLVASGRKILYRNYRGPRGGEIDIVARDGDVLSFVEVKTRTRKGYGRPLEAVTREKQELIERGANAWLKLLGRRDLAWRFDVVEVILSDGQQAEVNIVNNAF